MSTLAIVGLVVLAWIAFVVFAVCLCQMAKGN